MRATEAIKKIMAEKNIKATVLCNRIGIKMNTFLERLSHENISMEKLSEIVRAMDYKIVVMPRETRTPNGGIEIE